jgi:hypothetical protein
MVCPNLFASAKMIYLTIRFLCLCRICDPDRTVALTHALPLTAPTVWLVPSSIDFRALPSIAR